MIVLDTNVVSEFAKLLPDEKVKTWLQRQDGSRIWLCAVGLMEQIYSAERVLLKTRSDRFFRAIENLVKGQFRDVSSVGIWKRQWQRAVCAQDAKAWDGQFRFRMP